MIFEKLEDYEGDKDNDDVNFMWPRQGVSCIMRQWSRGHSVACSHWDTTLRGLSGLLSLLLVQHWSTAAEFGKLPVAHRAFVCSLRLQEQRRCVATCVVLHTGKLAKHETEAVWKVGQIAFRFTRHIEETNTRWCLGAVDVVTFCGTAILCQPHVDISNISAARCCRVLVRSVNEVHNVVILLSLFLACRGTSQQVRHVFRCRRVDAA
mmetsp:Transcript_55851/g.100214  ORF Transcript_55851/g.100214 Transcript_55851/m.100214 type:complete len:208 (-) Transcript_55851:1063-1686(-)